jgi:hypothetical protein
MNPLLLSVLGQTGFGLPVLQPTVRPTIVGTPVWYAEASTALDTLDIPITIPSDASRKLLVLWGTDGAQYPTAVTFDPTGEALVMPPDIVDELGDLRIAGYYLDNPTAGAKVLRIATATAVWSVAKLVVLKDAGAGALNSQTTANFGTASTILIEPDDAFSETITMLLDDATGIGGLTPLAGQVDLDEAVVHGGAFHAITARRAHDDNSAVDVGWHAAVEGNMLQLAFNVVSASGSGPPPSSVTPLSLWEMGETGTVFADTRGLSPLGLSLGSIGPGGAPLLTGGDGSVSVQNSLMLASHATVWAASSYWITVFCQPRSAPANNANRIILFKDSGSPPGGVSIEQYDDSSLLRAYIRNATGGAGTAIWIGAQTGQGALTLNVGHRIDLTFDGTTARLYLDHVEVASSIDAGLRGLQDNISPLEVTSRNVGGVITAPFDGMIGRIELQSGAPSAATIEAAAAARTISDPGAPGGITMLDIPLGNVAPSTTIDIDPADYATGLGGGSRNLTEVSDAAARMSFLNDNTATATIRITTPAAPTNAVNESARATISEDGGPASNEFIISWTRPGTSVTTHPFQTALYPSVTHSGVGSRPSYNASNPFSAAIICPMSKKDNEGGIQIVRLTGNVGTTSGLPGGLAWPHMLRPENTGSTSRAWNADSSLFFMDQSRSVSGDPTNSARSVLLDMTGTRGASAPGKVLKAASSEALGQGFSIYWFWDPLNPLRAYVLRSNGAIDEWWPIGGDGHATNEVNNVWGAVSGYGSFKDVRAHSIHCSFNGQYYAQHCKRNSDGRWGVRRRNLLTGALDAFVPAPSAFDPYETPLTGTSALGRYTKFEKGVTIRVYDAVTGAEMFNGDNIGLPGNLSHTDWTVVNGREYLVGPVSSAGIYMVDILTGVEKRISNFDSGNPCHMSCRNYLDLAETHGQVGGVVTGQRYGFVVKSNGSTTQGIRAFRMDPGGAENVLRYICNHRSVRTDDSYSNANESECHIQPSPNGRMVAFPSNWRVPGQMGSDYDVHGYVAIIPAGWSNANNSGL